MSKIQILMPMGGLGSRFAEQGYTIPKPLIPVDGKPMFKRALDSFASLQATDHIFVIRREHEEQYKLSEQIKQHLHDAKISILEENTHGAVETCMLAAHDIDDELPIIIADCDIYFESKSYFEKVASNTADGLLLTFESDHPRYSYVEVDENGKAIRTAEKVVISSHAILGGYCFKSGKLFKELSAEFLSNKLPENMKEYFLSHLFNILLAKNGAIEIAEVDNMFIFGTPDELNTYFSDHPQVKL
jgi:dTDP-glucose pyrophosphorylase